MKRTLRLALPSPTLAAAFVVLLAALAGISYAGSSSPSDPHRIRGCVTLPYRVLHVLGAGQACPKGDISVSWNEQGPKGSRGTHGGDGPRGATGHSGATGSQGSPGPQGPTGSPGAKGETGAKGDAGPTGAAGIQGMRGETGAKGETGTQGPEGETGTTGSQGPKGEIGTQGAKGEAGARGEKGETGPQGPSNAYSAAVSNGTPLIVSSSSYTNLATLTLPAGHYLAEVTISLFSFQEVGAVVDCALGRPPFASIGNTASQTAINGFYATVNLNLPITLPTTETVGVGCNASVSGVKTEPRAAYPTYLTAIKVAGLE